MAPPGGGSAARRKTALKRWGVRLGKALLTVVVTWLILRGAGFSLAEAGDLDMSIVDPDLAFLATSVAVLLAAFVLQAWLWSRILAAFGEPGVPLHVAASLVMVANLGRYIPGKIFQLAGLAVLARRAGLSAVRAGAAAVAAQVVNLLAAAVLGAWVAYESPALPSGAALATGVTVLLGLSGFFCFGGAGALLGWALRRSGHEGNLPTPGAPAFLAWLAGYLLSWVVYGLAFYCLAMGLGLGVPLPVAATAFASAYLVGYVLLFAPAGIGVRESVLAALLAPWAGPGGSLVLAGLQRVWITAVELAAAALGAVVLRKPASAAGGDR